MRLALEDGNMSTIEIISAKTSITKERTLIFHFPPFLVRPCHFYLPTFLVILRKPSRFLAFLPFSRALPNHNLQILRTALE